MDEFVQAHFSDGNLNPISKAGGVLGLRPRGSRCALAARASPSRLVV